MFWYNRYAGAFILSRSITGELRSYYRVFHLRKFALSLSVRQKHALLITRKIGQYRLHLTTNDIFRVGTCRINLTSNGQMARL